MLAPLLLTLAAAQPAAFDASRWHIVDPNAATISYLAQSSLILDNGVAFLRDSSFGDGTIDVDIAMHGYPSCAGIVFRAASNHNHEQICVRPHPSRHPDALQYTPV